MLRWNFIINQMQTVVLLLLNNGVIDLVNLQENGPLIMRAQRYSEEQLGQKNWEEQTSTMVVRHQHLPLEHIDIML